VKSREEKHYTVQRVGWLSRSLQEEGNKVIEREQEGGDKKQGRGCAEWTCQTWCSCCFSMVRLCMAAPATAAGAELEMMG